MMLSALPPAPSPIQLGDLGQVLPMRGDLKLQLSQKVRARPKILHFSPTFHFLYNKTHFPGCPQATNE